MKSPRLRSVVAVFVVLALVASGAMAAAPTVDSETTRTSTTSDVTDGMTVTNYSANASKSLYLEASFDSQNPKAKLLHNGSTIATYTSSDFNAEDTGSSPYYYSTNISHGAMEDVAMMPGENTTFTLRLFNDSTAENPDTTNVTIYVENSNDRWEYHVASSFDEDQFSLDKSGLLTAVGVTDLGGFASTLGVNDEAEFTAEDLTNVDANDTISVSYANSTALDRIDSVVGEASAGDHVKGVILKADGEAVPVYLKERPDDVDASDNYAILHDSSSEVTWHPGEDYDGSDVDSLSIRVTSDTWAQFDAYGWDTGLGTISW